MLRLEFHVAHSPVDPQPSRPFPPLKTCNITPPASLLRHTARAVTNTPFRYLDIRQATKTVPIHPSKPAPLRPTPLTCRQDRAASPSSRCVCEGGCGARCRGLYGVSGSLRAHVPRRSCWSRRQRGHDLKLMHWNSGPRCRRERERKDGDGDNGKCHATGWQRRAVEISSE